MKRFLSLHPSLCLPKGTLIARGCMRDAAERSCVCGDAQEAAAKRMYSLCLLDTEKEGGFPMAPEHPCLLSVSFLQSSALGLGPSAHSPFSLSSDLAQGHLQLGHLGRDFRADTSPISPSEGEGQTPMAVRYRNNTQRRFSMEAGSAAGWAGSRDAAGAGCHLPAGWERWGLIRGDLSPDILLDALGVIPVVPDKAQCASLCPPPIPLFLCLRVPQMMTPLLRPAPFREHFFLHH